MTKAEKKELILKDTGLACFDLVDSKIRKEIRKKTKKIKKALPFLYPSEDQIAMQLRDSFMKAILLQLLEEGII